jgi:hypothetical protein
MITSIIFHLPNLMMGHKEYLIHGSRISCRGTRRLVEETEAHVLIGLLSLLSRSSLSGSSRSSTTIGLRVGNTVLELLNLGPAVLSLNSNSQDLLVAVDNGVDNGGKGGVVDSKGDAGDGVDGTAEDLEELLLLNVENGSAEGLAFLVDLLDGHTVGEGGDVEHVEQGGLGRTNLVALLNELEIGGNFNGTTSDLGGNTESLEERGLTGFHTSVTGRNPDIGGSNGTSTGRGSDTVGEDLVLGLLEVAVGEDETNVAYSSSVKSCLSVRPIRERTLDVREQTLVLGVVVDEALESTTNLESSRVRIAVAWNHK